MIGRVLSGRIGRVKGRRETLKKRVLYLLGGWPRGLVAVKFVLKSQTSPYRFRTFNCSVTYRVMQEGDSGQVCFAGTRVLAGVV